MSVSILSAGIRGLESYYDKLPEVTLQAAMLALNDVAAGDGLALLRREMRKEVNFSADYLKQRTFVARKATKGSLEVTLRGRDRATSLARFADGQTPENTRGRRVRVRVQPGKQKVLDRAFLLRLRNNNLGLAIRLPPGKKPRGTEAYVELGRNLFLLYGPSVDQVMKGVADDQGPVIRNRVGTEFLRQFARLTRG